MKKYLGIYTDQYCKYFTAIIYDTDKYRANEKFIQYLENYVDSEYLEMSKDEIIITNVNDLVVI